MKAIHVGGLNYKNGGPSLSTYLTIQGLLNNGVEAHCVSRALDSGDKLICEESLVSFMKKPLISLMGLELIPGINSTIEELSPIDIIHLQGIWSYHMHKAARYAIHHRIPYIIAPRGSLYPEALRISSLKKKISMFCYQRKELEQASCVQVTCNKELEYYRELGYRNPVAVLPNPMEVSNNKIETRDVTRFGYLGRLHPRKRVERLIYAFAEKKDYFRDCELWIIGSEISEYEAFLKNEVRRLNLNNVYFKGFLEGSEKEEALSSLSFLINPSDFENFGNVITEALSKGVPIIATKGSPWQIVEDYHCGWWINNDQQTITNTMMEAKSVSSDDRIIMGLNGRRLVEKEFSVNVLGSKMKHLYNWILNGGSTPSFVDLV